MCCELSGYIGDMHLPFETRTAVQFVVPVVEENWLQKGGTLPSVYGSKVVGRSVFVIERKERKIDQDQNQFSDMLLYSFNQVNHLTNNQVLICIITNISKIIVWEP